MSILGHEDLCKESQFDLFVGVGRYGRFTILGWRVRPELHRVGCSTSV